MCAFSDFIILNTKVNINITEAHYIGSTTECYNQTKMATEIRSVCYQLYWLSSLVYEIIKLVQCVIKACVQQREDLLCVNFAADDRKRSYFLMVKIYL